MQKKESIMAVLHSIKATAQACTRGSFSLLAAAAMVFAAGAFAQSMDTAYVPFRVNVNATATAQLAGGVKFEKLVRAGSTDTLHIISESTTPVISSKVPKPVAMHSSRGKISLELSRQSYKGVDIALYSLNGKQIMHAKADASEILKSISHPNVRMGVYVLSVKGISGNAFTTRLTHSGGGMNIDVSLANENFSSGSPMEKSLPGDWTITVSAEGHLDTSYAFVPEAGRGNTPVQNITLRQSSSPSSSSAEDEPSSSSSSEVVPSSSSAEDEPSSSSTEDEPSSSSSEPPSSSSAELLICGSVPALGYATIPITPPALVCGNGETATYISWLGSPAIDWNNPNGGTYSDISVTANCGSEYLTASCPGTLTVQPMISCSMAWSTGVESFAIAPPAIACSDGSVPFDIAFSGSPDWENPAAGSYDVLAEANCGQGALPKISCGTLTVNPVTLTCGSVLDYNIEESLEIIPPHLTCSHGTLGTPAWENAPNWNDPMPGTYSNISATANCGLLTKTANCSGTLTVSPATLICGSVPISGFSGIAIIPPVLTCSNGKMATDIAWSASAPNWDSPAIGTYNDISATANCGLATKTANCSSSLSVSCSGNDNTSTQYCSEGTMKEYGSVTLGDQTYKTIVIGTQTWMAENLNYYVEGSKCFGEDGEVITDSRDEDYNPITKTLSNAEVQANCEKYGRLYDWSTSMVFESSCNSEYCSDQVQEKHQGICPSGWHIPSDAEWTTLTDYVGDSSTATKLKAASGWNSFNGIIGGTDQFGFSALPGGSGYLDGSFNNVGIGIQGFWWSTTGYNYIEAYSGYIHNGVEILFQGIIPKSSLLSVRCVQD